MIGAQGGDPAVTENPGLLPQAKAQKTVPAPESGYVAGFRSEEVGLACLTLGAGRTSDNPEIDYGAGVRFHLEVGDAVQKGEPLFTVYGGTDALCEAAVQRIAGVFTFSDAPLEERKLFDQVFE